MAHLSGKGQGKWASSQAFDAYKRKRNAKRKAVKQQKKRNRR